MNISNGARSPDAAIVFSNVEFRHGQKVILRDLSCSVAAGAHLLLRGPSGVGKTSLLRLIAGLDRPSCGDIWLFGRHVAGDKSFLRPELRGVGLVFQDFALFPHLSVAGNVAFGLRSLRASDRQASVLETLRLCRIEELANRFPHELSGGQQQRVAIARALAPQPKILLLDEPFSNLDGELRESLRLDIDRLTKQFGMTVVYATHEGREAEASATQTLVLT